VRVADLVDELAVCRTHRETLEKQCRRLGDRRAELSRWRQQMEADDQAHRLAQGSAAEQARQPRQRGGQECQQAQREARQSCLEAAGHPGWLELDWSAVPVTDDDLRRPERVDELLTAAAQDQLPNWRQQVEKASAHYQALRVNVRTLEGQKEELARQKQE